MALAKNTHLYEVLIRFGPDGYRGAHVIDLELITDGDEIVSGKELPARPLTKAEIGPIIGATNAKLIEAADQARAEKEVAAEERDNAKLAAFDATTRATNAEGQLAGLREAYEERVAQLVAAKDDVEKAVSYAAELEGKHATAEQERDEARSEADKLRARVAELEAAAKPASESTAE